MKKIISRENLKEKLLQWQKGQITAHELNDWAGENYPNDNVEYEDWDDKENSVTNEVLAALDMMDMNLMTPEDVPAYIKFLKTPPEHFLQGYNNLNAYLGKIDIKERAATLITITFYERFCQQK